MQLPAAFLAAADVCWPEQGPAPLPGRRARKAGDACGARPAWLPYLTYAQAMQICDLAALVWWECLQATDDPTLIPSSPMPLARSSAHASTR